ncbi:hypothetical protein DFJ73DRAFT_816251 [Zopfochytrium polystomum]|nr:hypothetical protein DFJ73DRAFT_816251 [Zopfochytrium polystomum]
MADATGAPEKGDPSMQAASDPAQDAPPALATAISMSDCVPPEQENEARCSRLRAWVVEAMKSDRLGTAVFWAERLVTMTNGSAQDVWLLARSLFLRSQYARTLIVIRKWRRKEPAFQRLLAHSMIKLKRSRDAREILQNLPADSSGSVEVEIAPVAGYNQESFDKWLIGIAFLEQLRMKPAKEAFLQSAALDPRFYEERFTDNFLLKSKHFNLQPFHALVSNHLLSFTEEQELMKSFNFRLCQEDKELIELLYSCQLNQEPNSQNAFSADIVEVWKCLELSFNLADDPIVALSKSNYLFKRCKYTDSLFYANLVAKANPLSNDYVWTTIACMHELGQKSDLFALGHKLSRADPKNPAAWYAAGCFYLLQNNTIEAKRNFRKALEHDRRFVPAWIGFGQAYEAESAREQAIMSYSEAVKAWPGDHYPMLCNGLLYIEQGILNTGREFITNAHIICPEDPLESLESIGADVGAPKMWETIQHNLGQSLLKQRDFDRARQSFKKVLALNRSRTSTLTALAMVEASQGKLEEATIILHEVLALDPFNTAAGELLKSVLDSLSRVVFEPAEAPLPPRRKRPPLSHADRRINRQPRDAASFKGKHKALPKGTPTLMQYSSGATEDSDGDEAMSTPSAPNTLNSRSVMAVDGVVGDAGIAARLFSQTKASFQQRMNELVETDQARGSRPAAAGSFTAGANSANGRGSLHTAPSRQERVASSFAGAMEPEGGEREEGMSDMEVE